MRIPIGVLFLCWILYGCDSGQFEKQSNGYFDVDSTIQVYVTNMPEFVTRSKTVILNGQEQTETAKISIEDVKRDLSAFSQIDLNKAEYKNVWEVTEKESVLTYETTEPERTELQFVRIVGLPESLNRIVAQTREENSVFTSGRNYELTFGMDQILTYSVQGFEKKKALADSTSFRVEVSFH